MIKNMKRAETPVSGQVSGDPIDGVVLRPLAMHADARGCFTEVFLSDWNSMAEPRQWSVVHSVRNTFRGCHLHKRHDEYLCTLQGEMSLGLRDERPWSPTRGNWQLYRLHGSDLAAVIWPAGVVHGWYSHDTTLHLQSVSESYASYGPDDNWGVHWADPELGIPWPFDAPLLAERAAAFPSLAALRDALLPWGRP